MSSFTNLSVWASKNLIFAGTGMVNVVEVGQKLPKKLII